MASSASAAPGRVPPASRATVGPRTLLVVNPAAGGGAARRAAWRVEDYLRSRRVAADVVTSRSSEHLRGLPAEAAGAGYARVATLGGDGTFHHTVAGALASGAASSLEFAFLPAGNGNDIARGLGIPTDPLAAARLLATAPAGGVARRCDVLRARPADGQARFYLGAGGLGLDAEAAELVRTRYRGWPGTLRYLAAAFAVLREFAPLELEAELDVPLAGCVPGGSMETKRWRGEALLAAVANVPCYGAGICIAPGADPADGLLDVTLVAPLALGRILEALPGTLRREGRHPRWPELIHYRARSVTLRASRPARMHGDGELVGTSPLRVDVVPAAVRVVVPARNP